MAEFRERLAGENIPLVLHPGAELRIDTSLPARIKTGEILTLNDGPYVLLELPEEALPGNIEEFFWNLQVLGYGPILSHVERNPILREHPELLLSWVEKGILTQVTAASLVEEFAEEIGDFARLLVERRMVHMLVTDTHGIRMRKPKLSEARRVVEEISGPEEAERIVGNTLVRIAAIVETMNYHPRQCAYVAALVERKAMPI